MICSIIASAPIIIAIALLMGLTPEQVTDDLISLITPKDSLRDEARAIRGNKKKHGIYASLMKMKAALAATGKSKQFSLVCFLSLALFAAGAILSVLIKNLFLMPYCRRRLLCFRSSISPIRFPIMRSAPKRNWKPHSQSLRPHISAVTISYPR